MGAASHWWLHKASKAWAGVFRSFSAGGALSCHLESSSADPGATSLAHAPTRPGPRGSKTSRQGVPAIRQASPVIATAAICCMSRKQSAMAWAPGLQGLPRPSRRPASRPVNRGVPGRYRVFRRSDHCVGKAMNWPLGLLPRRSNSAKGFEACSEPGEEGARSRLAAFVATGSPTTPMRAMSGPGCDLEGFPPTCISAEISPAQCWHAVRTARCADGHLDRATEKFLKEILWRELSYHLVGLRPDLPNQPFRPDSPAFPLAGE